MTTPSNAVLAKRLSAVEARLAEIEQGYGQVIYTMRRRQVGTELGVARILDHLGLPAVTDAEIDAVLDQE